MVEAMIKPPEGLKCEITSEQAYPKGVPSIPDGWEYARFQYNGSIEEDEATLEPDGSLSGVRIQRELRVVVRRKPKPHAFQRKVIGRSAPGQSFSVDIHAYGCGECGKPESDNAHVNVPKPRRWVVEFWTNPNADFTGSKICNHPSHVLREVKPITREHLIKILDFGTFPSLRNFSGQEAISSLARLLRSIGIEVEE